MRVITIPSDPWRWLKNRTLPLFVVLVALLALHPLFIDEAGHSMRVFPALIGVIPLVGISVLSTWKRAAPLVFIFCTVMAFAGFVYGFDLDAIAHSPLELCVFIYYAYATILIGATLLGSSAQLDDRVYGGFVVYLLSGVAFATLHRYISAIDPSAYWGSVHAQNTALEWDTALYFSMVTLTTLGFGDIVPVNAWARAVTTLESTTGLFITAVVIARLASAPSGGVRPSRGSDEKHSG